ncbi:hypothetical protein [Gallaecimonas sp. GXIMD4217]
MSRSGYYDWLKRQPSQRRQQDQALLADIHRLFKQALFPKSLNHSVLP